MTFAALASTAGNLVGSSAHASTPSLIWADARRVAIHCLAQSRTGADAIGLENALCARAGSLAGSGAPMPVERAESGDPALLTPGTVTLLIHFSVERAGDGRTVAFTIRPHRASNPDAHILFGTAPQAVELPAETPLAALDAPLDAALAEILPWRQTPLFPRPL